MGAHIKQRAQALHFHYTLAHAHTHTHIGLFAGVCVCVHVYIKIRAHKSTSSLRERRRRVASSSMYNRGQHKIYMRGAVMLCVCCAVYAMLCVRVDDGCVHTIRTRNSQIRLGRR